MRHDKTRARFGSALGKLAPRQFKIYACGNVAGMRWAICRAGFPWAVNGYVKLPKDHPLFGMDYSDMPYIPVHDGITYGCDPDGWIGFATGRPTDVWARMHPLMRQFSLTLTRLFGDQLTYWTRRRVARETRRLAAGLDRYRESLRQMILREQLLRKQGEN